MDNLRSSLEVLFRDADPEVVLKRFFSLTEQEKNIDRPWFESRYETLKDGHNRDEIRAIGEILETKWAKGRHVYSYEDRESEVFNVLSFFTAKVLTEEEGEPVCRFEELLRWRELSMKLGEDMLTTSFLADRDVVAGRDRTFFSWRPVIRTDNRCLREILDRGMTELHFHLKGSSFQFELSWLSLMNHIAGRGREFARFTTFRMARSTIDTTRTEKSLYFLCIKAALIRLYMFRCLTGEEEALAFLSGGEKVEVAPGKALDEWVVEVLKAGSEKEIYLYLGKLQQEIGRTRYFFGRRYGKDCVDYAVPGNSEEHAWGRNYRGTTVFHGERWLLYAMFKAIYRKERKYLRLSSLFYAYLIIKERLRSELVQVNPYVGFGNFAEYQGRKEWFITRGSVYETLLYSMAIHTTMSDQALRYLEARVVPASRVNDLIRQIRECDARIGDPRFLQEERKDYFYVFHFIKTQLPCEKGGGYQEEVKPRNWGLRQWVKEQALALNELRKKSSDLSDRMVGVDAASSEIGFRPEIFAQAFRYLKGYSCEMRDKFLRNSVFPRLGFTYHAGEDFLDMADGLRAIDETVRFLEFGRGDRIGHALALGVSAAEYYKLKKRKVILSKQDFLDNVVWLLERIRYYGIECSSSLLHQFLQWYHRLYADIYDSLTHAPDPDPTIYYGAYLLRGDDPWLYFKDREWNEKVTFNPVSFWNRMGMASSSEADMARRNRTARRIYREYHFNRAVKERGRVFEEFQLPEGYTGLIDALQQAMRRELAGKHIAIEANPTSNQLIGSYKRYAEHPMVKFFNLGLGCSPEVERNCAQISVSLNTDDQGVFATYLENEYALMAIALEKEKDEQGKPRYTPRMIYDWLERVRRMGFEQAFRRVDGNF